MKSVQTMNGAAHESFICKSGAKLVQAGKKCVADKCVQLTGVQPTRVDCISFSNSNSAGLLWNPSIWNYEICTDDYMGTSYRK